MFHSTPTPGGIVTQAPLGISRSAYSRMVAERMAGQRSEKREPRKWFEIRVIDKPAPKPLSPELEARLDEIMAYRTPEQERAERKEQRLNERLRALGIDTSAPPKSKRQTSLTRNLDARINEQIAAQPREHHAQLRTLYDTWTIGNQLFFEGELKLPIISIEAGMGMIMASCSSSRVPTELKFNRITLKFADEKKVQGLCYHEMAHQFLVEAGSDSHKHEGHHQRFADVCAHIAKHLGWKAPKNLRDACHWPDELT